MSIRASITLVGTMLFVPAALAHAQEAPTDSLAVTLDLGFVNTSGNTQVTTFNTGELVEFVTGPWSVTQSFSVVYGRNGDSTTTSQWNAGVRGEYAFTPRLGVYADGRYDRNRFAGIARRFVEAAGLSALLLEGEGNKLTVEAGASLNQQTSFTTDVTTTYAAGRAAAAYRRDLAERSYVTISGEFLPNFKTSEDYRINGVGALVAPISNRIALKLSYDARFDHLPEPGFKKWDRILTAGLQIVF